MPILMAGALMAAPALADPIAVGPTRITRLSVQQGGQVYIKIEDGASVIGAPAACSTNGFWQFGFLGSTPAGQAMLATALAAKASAGPVFIHGTTSCSAHPNIEDAQSIDILP